MIRPITLLTIPGIAIRENFKEYVIQQDEGHHS